MKIKYLLIVSVFVSIGLGFSCKKSTDSGAVTPPPPKDTVVVITPPVDPPIANSIGFFLNDWQPKTFTAPSYKDTTITSFATYTVTVNPSAVITKIPLSIFGNNLSTKAIVKQ